MGPKDILPLTAPPTLIESLKTACQNGDINQVREILAKNPSYLNCKIDNEDMTPLLVSVYWGHTALVEFLLQQSGIDVSIRVGPVNTICARTALSCAFDYSRNFKKPNYDIASMLIKGGADINEIIERNNTNLLLGAWLRGGLQQASIQIATQLIMRFGASIEISENLFNSHWSGKGPFMDKEMPKRIALTKKHVEEIKNAKQLGIDIGRLFFAKHSELDLKIATFLFQANSAEMHAFKAGQNKIRTQLALSTLTPKTMTFIRNAFNALNEIKWRQRQAEYNAKPDHPYGPGAMVVYRGGATHAFLLAAKGSSPQTKRKI